MNPPTNAIRPPAIQAPIISSGVVTRWATRHGLMKIPAPTIPPMTVMVAPNRPNRRARCGSAVVCPEESLGAVIQREDLIWNPRTWRRIDLAARLTRGRPVATAHVRIGLHWTVRLFIELKVIQPKQKLPVYPKSQQHLRLMRFQSKFATALCLVSFLLCSVHPASAARKKSESPTPSPAAAAATPAASASPAKAQRAIPFKGMIQSVDKRAKTFTIASKQKSRVFNITERTVLTKAGNPATLNDLSENEEVHGSYWKNADGSLEAKHVRIGPLTPEEKAAQEARKARRAERKKEKEAAESAASPSPKPSP